MQDILALKYSPTMLCMADPSDVHGPAVYACCVLSQDILALKYSPTMLCMVDPSDGTVTWQNSASMAALGIVSARVAGLGRGAELVGPG